MQKARVSVAVAMIAMLLCPLPGMAQSSAQSSSTTTPVKHVVIIFDENNSFDHYFGAYPVAANSPGEPRFEALPGTPTINGLTSTLKESNPDAILNGAQAPFRLDRSQNVTCDNDNHYTDEQKAYNGGLLNQFAALLSAPASTTCTIPWLSMGYYDGNTVTALWNYAQHFAMSDNFFASNFGTTVMGHLNLIAGQTHGATTGATPPTNSISGKVINGSVIVNVDPIFDDCATGAPSAVIQMNTPNVGTLLNAKGVSWGWFYGDWTPTSVTNGIATCSSEYDSHYAPFQYYAATANPHHLTPTSTKMIGQTDRANHQYAITDFWNAVDNGNMPAVTFLKPPHIQNGHPADSSPLAEQTFLVDTINRLMLTPEWKDTAIFIAYDDSDGWYDHVMPPIVNPSSDSANDALLGSSGLCGTPAPGAFQDRCGYGPRLPFVLISPFAKQNFVSHTLADQSSILRFIEDNWNTGQIGNQSFDAIAGSLLNMFDFQGQGFQFFDRRLILNDTTGEVIF